MEKNPFQFTLEFWNFFSCIRLIKKFSIFIASSAQKMKRFVSYDSSIRE